MPLDSNSRFIAGVCGVAVALLLAWFHGNGSGLDRGLSRCVPDARQADDVRDCPACHQAEPSHPAAMIVGDVSQPPVRIVSSAPRA